MANPFPTPYPTLLGHDPKSQFSLQTAVGEALLNFPGLDRPFRAAISITAIDDTVQPMDFKHAGVQFRDNFYSASLLKMGALYAAFELKSSVNKLASESLASSPNELFDELHSNFDLQITEKFRTILSALGTAITPEINSTIKPPKYELIFSIIPLVTGGFGLMFSDTFQTNMIRMIVNSDNSAAAVSINALGYSWVNGTLHAGGFFFPEVKTGMWLAGTFAGLLTPINIPSINDGLVAQATTCFDMANLFAHIFQKTLVDTDSSQEMLNILFTTAAVGNDESFMDSTRRRGLPHRNFSVTHSKIGLGPLKTGRMVASEGAIVEHIETRRKFLVVWQNSFNDDSSIIAMGFVVDRTIELFLTTP